MAELHGEEPSRGRCPGDGDESAGVEPCRRWQSTAEPGVSVSWEDRVKQLGTCDGCRGRGPLTDEERESGAGSDDDRELLDHVERIIIERRAGRRVRPEHLSTLVWAALVEWERHDDAYARAHRARVKCMYEMTMAQLGAMGGRR